MSTAILSALPEEQSSLVQHLEHPQRLMHAGRAFWRGELHDRPVVLALSADAIWPARITEADTMSPLCWSRGEESLNPRKSGSRRSELRPPCPVLNR